MNWLINPLVFILFFVAMEGAAWLAHKYLMHGPLWFIHKDHHKSHERFLELNDIFMLLFAVPSWLFIMYGWSESITNWRVFAGLGIAFYGVIYFVLHEVFVHQRISWFRSTQNTYLKKLRRAHFIHHKNKQRSGGSNFGLLIFRK